MMGIGWRALRIGTTMSKFQACKEEVKVEAQQGRAETSKCRQGQEMGSGYLDHGSR